MAYTKDFPPDPRGKPPKEERKWPPGSNKRERDPAWHWPDKNFPQDTKFSERHGEVDMSNKFLPFVVENSTPLHIFKTLMSRSKGMNQVLIVSIFNLILTHDIKELRKKVKDLPEMPLEKLYEELLIKYPQTRVNDTALATFQIIEKYFSEKCKAWDDELNSYTPNDVMLFFCGMAHARLAIDDYTDFPYDQLINGSKSDEILDNIQDHVMFDDKGISVCFDNEIELRCYILYFGLFRYLMDPNASNVSYCATLKQIKS